MTAPLASTSSLNDQQLVQLRALLLGVDEASWSRLQRLVLDREAHTEHTANVLAEAIKRRAGQDQALVSALAPTVEKVLTQSIDNDPQRLANALYPVMGPAIRKSIHEVLAQTLQTFNQLLEQSLSPRSLLWRFDAWRTGRSYTEVLLLKTLIYRVEQVFLIHRETGLLLQHVVSPNAVSKDPDLVSGMLTAIQDFVRDSFEVQKDEALNQLSLGDVSVFIEQGPYAVLAAVVRGNPPADLRILLADTLAALHSQLHDELQAYQGDVQAFDRTQPLLTQCLQSQSQVQKRRFPWLAMLVLTGMLAGIGVWTYQYYRDYQIFQTAVQLLQQEPGVVVTATQAHANHYHIEVLRDPLARGINSLFSAIPLTIQVNERPFVSLDDSLSLARAQQLLKPPPSVKLDYQAGVLHVSGSTDKLWQQQLMTTWSLLPNVQALDSEALTIHDNEALEREQRLNHLVDQIQQTPLKFANNDAQITDPSAIKKTSDSLLELISLARQNQKNIQLNLSGYADDTGTVEANNRLITERVKTVTQALIKNGVPAALINSLPTQANVTRNERSVHYQIQFY
ncbi:OmpA family protein [Thiolinea disciformis]|uniref:OmpA family protein n=1 Tax=Thiolinea disciformis TaxID=125614 RepID=UPI0003732D5E|nr:OmpA family protein [Thiolinea disciformis]